MKNLKATQTAVKEYMDRLMSSKNTWSIAPIPSAAWAKMVFPDMPEEAAVEKLWEEILKAVKADKEDPVAAWEEHKANLKKSMNFLNMNSFRKLHIKNSRGTDLVVELPEGHQWLGGSEFTDFGIEFLANMPTEEVFTLPVKTGVDGKAVSTKPLSYNGNIIDNFSITFKNGKITEYNAETGYDVLKSLVETDEGSHYLGEVALVPFDSAISQSGILFYNTLFDENASCHLAIGKAYLGCIKDAESKTKEQLEGLGINDSLTHVDFMIGSSDLEITGTTAEGKEVPVFKNGNFAF
jgi:aminopeptidase